MYLIITLTIKIEVKISKQIKFNNLTHIQKFTIDLNSQIKK